MSSLKKQVVNATKWASITEVLAKLVAPISTMILARLLTPEAFGILVTATIVISFAEIFSDAGFQNFIIYRQFSTKGQFNNTTNVAFWTNMILGIVIWILIIIFSSQISAMVGSPGYGLLISISSICIPLTAVSSIPLAILKKDLNYKSLFSIRLVSLFIPLFVTVPLALIFRNYWALVIGLIVQNLANLIIVFIKTQWRPIYYYNWNILREMFSYCSWSIIESILAWLTSYVDLFIIGHILHDDYLGLYRVAINSVGQILGLITAIFMPIIFSALSRCQTDIYYFKKTFLKFQNVLGFCLIPLGFGIYIFRDLITSILLGEQWTNASYLLGLWGITNSFVIIFAQLGTTSYRALGVPKYSVYTQFINVLIIIPAVYYSVHISFDFLCEMRALIRLSGVIISFIFLNKLLRLSIWENIMNVLPQFVCATISAVIIYYLPHTSNMLSQIMYAILAIIIYLSLMTLNPQKRKTIFEIKSLFFKTHKNN